MLASFTIAGIRIETSLDACMFVHPTKNWFALISAFLSASLQCRKRIESGTVGYYEMYPVVLELVLLLLKRVKSAKACWVIITALLGRHAAGTTARCGDMRGDICVWRGCHNTRPTCH